MVAEDLDRFYNGKVSRKGIPKLFIGEFILMEEHSLVPRPEGVWPGNKARR